MEDILATTTQLASLYFSALLFQPLWKLWTKTQYYLSYPVPQEQQPTHGQPPQCHKEQDETLVCKEEVKIVMSRLGLCYEAAEGVDIVTNRDMVGAYEVSRVFSEVEPSMDEVKEAFDVFDENTDGFISAADLQKVLCSLGLKERYGLDECQSTIKAVVMNQDGLIDFDKFAIHMDNCF